MTKYEKVYSFNVFDEIKKGEKVYLIDRAKLNSSSIVICVNETSTATICKAVEYNNDDNRFEFYKVVKTDE